MSEIIDGLYAYRFKGFAQDNCSITNFLVGVGTLRIEAQTVKESDHRATYLRLTGGAKQPADGHFTVTGNIDWHADDCRGSATLIFSQLDVAVGLGQVLTGNFAVVQASEREYWLTSYGGADVRYGARPPVKATELVEGELRWISA